MKRSLTIPVLLFVILTGLIPQPSQAVRLKDISSIKGVRDNQLIGYGLVVGLNGTGDGYKATFTTNGLVNMMENMGIHLNSNDVKVKNVAGVMVTARLQPFAKIGQEIDVLLSSLGDAKSLQGGTLLATPLKGLDGKVYALAQGPIGVGGFAMAGGGGGGVQKNHPTVARIPGGASVERELPNAFAEKDQIIFSLDAPDFTTSSRAVDAINSFLGGDFARARDSATINVEVPENHRKNFVGFLSAIENITVVPDVSAKVVLDERTGTVVMGQNVRIAKIAVSHGNLNLQIGVDQKVSQPLPLSGGQTVVSPTTTIFTSEGGDKLIVLDEGPTMEEVVRILNAIGVSPRDLIAIFQSIKAAGALQASLEII